MSKSLEPLLSKSSPLHSRSQIKNLIKKPIAYGLVEADKYTMAEYRLDPNVKNVKRGKFKQGSYQTYLLTTKGIKYMFWVLDN